MSRIILINDVNVRSSDGSNEEKEECRVGEDEKVDRTCLS